MTEPLGRSQVLEYLSSLSHSNRIYLISFERKNAIQSGQENEIKELVKDAGIEWRFFQYSNRFGIASTMMQVLKASWFASGLFKKHQFEIVHARSLIPAVVGFILKTIYGVKLVFDIRGFSIEEKVDRGRLKKESYLFNILKRIESHLYKSADHIVTLTHSAKEILAQDKVIQKNIISVIPTCASRETFRTISRSKKLSFKASMQYAPNDRLVIHTGTVTGWYDFESEVKLVGEMMQQDETIHFLVLNKNDQPYIQELVRKYDLPSDRVKLRSVPFEDVYKYLNIADFSLFFIKPSYSKKASFPTKFAENVACLLPSITNIGIGDMDFYLQQYDVGYAVELAKIDTNANTVAESILTKVFDTGFSHRDFETLFDQYLGKHTSITKYQNIYDSVNKI